MKKNAVSLFLLAGMLVLSACAPRSAPTTPVEPTQTQGPTQGNMGIANPSAVFCEDHGGKYEIRTAADGSQSGACLLPDGNVCDGWAFFRGECGPQGEQKEDASGDLPDSNKPIEAAIQALAQEMNIQPQEVGLVSAEKADWPDACLGLAGASEVCAQVITPGYRVVLKVGEQTVTYRTNALGDVLRKE